MRGETMRPPLADGLMCAHQDERTKWARELCQFLTDTITRRAPIGLSAWRKTWLITSEASANFIEVLTRWEASGHDADLVELLERCHRLLDAWALAVDEFERCLE